MLQSRSRLIDNSGVVDNVSLCDGKIRFGDDGKQSNKTSRGKTIKDD
jgi:hypothetical protein